MNRLLVIVTSSLILGISSFALQFSAARPVEIRSTISEFQAIQSNFEFLDTAKVFGDFNQLRANIKITNSNVQGHDVRLSARGEITGGKELLGATTGDVYSCSLELRPSKYNARAGYSARCKDELKIIRKAEPALAWIGNLRESFLANATGVTRDSEGLVAGLAIGDSSMLSEDLISDMKAVSLTHLTAVSGANCAIILAMVYLITRKLGGSRWARLIAGLITLFAYVALVGPQPSVLRASVMAGAVLIAISLGRKAAALGALGLSVLILLVADPWLATDFGFALSVAATAGLLILTQPLYERLVRYLPKWLAISVAVVLSAQIFCLPILLQLQPGLATYSIPANLLAEPLVAPITVLGILAVIFTLPFPWLAQVLYYLASFGGWLIAWIANYFSNLPMPTLTWPAGLAGSVAALSVILGFLLWLRAGPTQLRNIGLVTLAVIFSASFASIISLQIRTVGWPVRDWQIINCDVGQGDALVLRSQGAIAVVDVGKTDRAIDSCLTRLGVTKIDLLVLTHFDLDHVGGVRGALQDRSVSVVLVSPFKDERWGATGTNLYLSSLGAKIIEVEKKVTGKLGSVSWQVLSPNHDAAGAEDSNDASISMLWNFADFNLVTMADLGEKGQMRMSSNESWWKDSRLHKVPLILKVAHHGSADQYPELIEELKPDLSLISVGRSNTYGHPTQRTLKLLESTGSQIARTDILGSIAVTADASGLVISGTGQQ